MGQMTPLLTDLLLRNTFDVIPMVFEIRDRGQVIASVYARLEVEGGRVLCRNQPLTLLGIEGKDRDVEVRLVDQGGALYMDLGTMEGGRNGGNTTITFPQTVFSITPVE